VADGGVVIDGGVTAVAKVAIQIAHHSIVGARMLLTFRGRTDHKGSGK
jgi:hypothetical protein